MAEYKCTSPPSTIAMHRISAVKCKGKSPTYSEQTSSKSAPPKASGDVPSGAPKKKTWRGGKGKAKVHAIVSSALVPPSVTNRMQETHHTAAPVAAPISAPVMVSTEVGGPSHAPVRVPTTITSFKPSGVTYTKTEVPKNVQAFSGFTGQEGLHTIRKPPMAWKGMAPSKPPVSLEARMTCAAIVNNVVVSLSQVTLDLPLAPLLECIATPTLAEWAEHDACQKARRKTCRGAKKGKKDSVHMAPLDPSLKGKNIIIFTDAEVPNKEVSNPIDAESRETLFIPNPQGYNHDDMEVNPKHPRALFYQLLVVCYNQDPSGESFKRIINLYLDAPSNGEQDLSNEEVGHSPQLFTLPPDEDTIKPIGKITSWTPNMTPTWMMIMVIEGMFLTSTLTQWLTANSC